MRRAIAEHMVRSVHTSAHVTSVHEVDMSAIVRYREAWAAEFERRERFKLTYTPFFVEAAVAGLRQHPWLNASVDGDRILVRKAINIGIAVAVENGLIVPVIRGADGLNFVGLARSVNDLATRARTRKLAPADVADGTFTITNPGVFGTLIGTPIINQPQVAILGVGAIKKRVVVVSEGGQDAIAIRSMMFLTLSFDHRLVDGALAGRFLAAVAGHLESFDPRRPLL
jgi:2-oxoglutarate dehydrogenase E2 component (dihydrolipoamide succinyltransferase)